MRNLKKMRMNRGLSQRRLARRASLAFRTVQLMESGRHDARLSSIGRIAEALGHSARGVERVLDEYLEEPADSILSVSRRMVEDREEPGSKVGPRLEFIPEPTSAQKSVMHQILGIRRIAGIPQGRGIQTVQMFKGLLCKNMFSCPHKVSSKSVSPPLSLPK